MEGVFEHEWLQKKCDVKRCMKVGKVSDTVLSVLLPQFFSKVERLEGDGGAGTVKLITLNPAVSGRVEKTIKEKVLVHDKETCYSVWMAVGHPKFRKLKNITKVTPSLHDLVDSIVAWKLEYEPIHPATPPEMIHSAVMKLSSTMSITI